MKRRVISAYTECMPLRTVSVIPHRTLQHHIVAFRAIPNRPYRTVPHHIVLSHAIAYPTVIFRVLPYLALPYGMMQHGTMQVIADADEHGAAVLGVLMKATVKVSKPIAARYTVANERYL